MGYMGFGMKREVYTRKAKKPYAYLKSLYGEQLEKHLKSPSIKSRAERKLSEQERQELRKQVAAKVRKENRQRIITVAISVVATVVFMFALVWLVRRWFGI